MRARDGDWVAVDWGTTTMRAALVDAAGTVRARAPNGPGMGPLAREGGGAARFEGALTAAVSPWLGADAIDALVCGMAGARQGWVEAPYRDVPAGLDGLLASAVRAPTADARLNVRIVPGLCVRGDRPDVMRGEETQLLGLVHRAPGVACACLPGTHSKWVRLTGDRVRTFRTHMTGELNAVLTDGSVLAAALRGPSDRSNGASDADAFDADAFDMNAFDAAVEVALAEGGAALDRLFAIRAGALLVHGYGPARARATLSGLLIGAEIARERGRGGEKGDGGIVHLVGGGTLTTLYARALALVGVRSATHDGGDLAVAGLAAMRQGGG